jgi:hypothetical protein
MQAEAANSSVNSSFQARIIACKIPRCATSSPSISLSSYVSTKKAESHTSQTATSNKCDIIYSDQLYAANKSVDYIRSGKVLLDQLGFFWKLDRNPAGREANRWDIVFGKLQQFKLMYGHLNIPVNSTAHVVLTNWANQAQQQDASAGVMERERVKRLVEFGILIDEVQKAGQDDVCGSKHNSKMQALE